MEFIKHNIGWDAEPNAPMPEIKLINNNSKLSLSFYLNSFIYPNIDEESTGVIDFINCYKYRIGPTNDEGFYKGQCRFYKTGIPWGNFYEIKNSTWKKDFPKDEIILDKTLKNIKNLNHYLFYFRDETFECISESFEFNIKESI